MSVWLVRSRAGAVPACIEATHMDLSIDRGERAFPSPPCDNPFLELHSAECMSVNRKIFTQFAYLKT
ncbi:hypothetical protein KTH_49370 [Thermosporothrix hazakensis]|nr:hypothetical protein KTH_49370 [Thermosporothrix hazakensis]